MSLDVLVTPAGLASGAVEGRTVVVVDILRASTTICAALQHGARAVIPAADEAEARRLARAGGEDALLAGERGCLPITGFALGNSPAEMTAERVRGRTIVMTTTNGTRALLATAGAGAVYVGGAVNFSVVTARLERARARSEPIVILCAGRDRNFALDDVYAAGRLVQAVLGSTPGPPDLSDGARAALDLAICYGPDWTGPLALSRGGRDLAALGYDRDIAEAARVDAYPILPVFSDGRLTAAPDPGADQTFFTP